MSQKLKIQYFPYTGVVAFKSATRFVVGKNTILTNKHVSKNYKVGDRITAHPNSGMKVMVVFIE